MEHIFGISEKALSLCEERAKLISSNLANSSTPHYKAKDIDFQGLLSRALNEKNDQSNQTSNFSSGESNLFSSPPIMYRIPMQESLDGNTVDQEIERKNFIENSVRYEVNLTLIQNKTKEIMEAIKGE